MQINLGALLTAWLRDHRLSTAAHAPQRSLSGAGRAARGPFKCPHACSWHAGHRGKAVLYQVYSGHRSLRLSHLCK